MSYDSKKQKIEEVSTLFSTINSKIGTLVLSKKTNQSKLNDIMGHLEQIIEQKLIVNLDFDELNNRLKTILTIIGKITSKNQNEAVSIADIETEFIIVHSKLFILEKEISLKFISFQIFCSSMIMI